MVAEPLPLRRTPLHQRHLDLGARLVPFASWEMPLQYTSVRDEHHAVRTTAGLFDVSHMGRVEIVGAGAAEGLQGLVTGDVMALEPGRALYTLICREDGGIIDDLIVYRLLPDRFLIVLNSANHDKDVAWISSRLPPGADFQDVSEEIALIACQGPSAADVAGSLGLQTDGIPPFGVIEGMVADVPVLAARTGYTGEDGFEFFVPSHKVGEVWDAILATPVGQGRVAPSGLAARDVCRLEAALRLYGNDMDETVNPYEAGLGWTVNLEKGPFVGRDALVAAREAGPKRILTGIRGEGRVIPRHGSPVYQSETRVGEVTSGTHSFWLEGGIGLALLDGPRRPVGTPLEVDQRGTRGAVVVTKLPFYRGSVKSVRAAVSS